MCVQKGLCLEQLVLGLTAVGATLQQGGFFSLGAEAMFTWCCRHATQARLLITYASWVCQLSPWLLYPPLCASFLQITLADPGGADSVRPQQDPILSFSHIFLPKSMRVRGRRPHGSVAPQQEILDPPLNCTVIS